jgi:competence protein ComEA
LQGAPAKAPGLTHRININTANQAELELLPHVGPAIAKRIMDYRALHGPFKTIADLDKVKGIGPKTMAKIAPLVTVE